jgi:hypothetical protein
MSPGDTWRCFGLFGGGWTKCHKGQNQDLMMVPMDEPNLTYDVVRNNQRNFTSAWVNGILFGVPHYIMGYVWLVHTPADPCIGLVCQVCLTISKVRLGQGT